jgi:tetratricopeptide (TPR) repeat protein
VRFALLFILFTLALSAQAPPRSDTSDRPSAREQGESSSKDTRVDLAAPGDDAAKHPDSEDMSETSELKPWNPHKAMKNVEVGDFYMKKGNYRAAISRYREALEWKPRDAVATFKLAQALDKTDQKSEAAEQYQAYLKILPNGVYAADCKKALERLNTTSKR